MPALGYRVAVVCKFSIFIIFFRSETKALDNENESYYSAMHQDDTVTKEGEVYGNPT